MTAILFKLGVLLAALMTHIPLLGAVDDRTIETTITRVDSVKENLQDTQLEVKADLSLPTEKVDKQVRRKSYTSNEFTQLKQEMGAKVRNFKNEKKTTQEEIAIVFDLLNQQCAGKEISNFLLTPENTNTFIGDSVESGC